MKIEIRSANEAVIEGYVNAVGRDSRVLPSPKGRFVEQVKPQTFARAIENSKDVEVRFNHTLHLGSVNEGNLELREDNIGLYAKAIITVPEIIEKARCNELRGWSFGFVAKTDEWEDMQNGLQRRYLEEIELREVSILDKLPAYVGTSIEMRDDNALVVELRSIEETAELIDNMPTPKHDFTNKKREIEILKLRHRGE